MQELPLAHAEPFEVGGRGELSRQERGEVPSDRGVLRVREADLRERGPGAALRLGVHVDLREEAVEQHAADLDRGQLAAQALADELAATAGDHDGHGLRLSAQERLLGGAAGVA